MKQDIETPDDIKLLVDSFYQQVREDDLIGPVFNDVIGNRWPQHLEKMYGFWQTLLFNEQAYSGSPFPPHAGLPVEQKHFDRWIGLFNQTLDELFEGERAKEARWRAERMAELFVYKIEHLRNNPRTSIL